MTAVAERIILGSGSPRRSELLTSLGVPFDVVAPGIDEPVDATVDDVAHAKFEHLTARYPGRTVLTADTLVLVGTTRLGKPDDLEHARAMLTACSGVAITVASAICIGRDDACESRRVESIVQLRALTAGEIDRYLATGVANDKAGALSLQGEAANFIDRTAPCFVADCGDGGCYSNVVGFPLCAVADLLGVNRNPALCKWPDLAIGRC